MTVVRASSSRYSPVSRAGRGASGMRTKAASAMSSTRAALRVGSLLYRTMPATTTCTLGATPGVRSCCPMKRLVCGWPLRPAPWK
jgi:hypothetical protein